MTLILRTFFFSTVLICSTFSSLSRASDVLHKAIEANDLAEVKRILDSGMSVNVRVENNTFNTGTPLHTALWSGHKDIVMELLNRKADVLAENQIGQTALWVAAQRGYANIVQLMLEMGAKEVINKCDQSNSKTPLRTAIANFHVATAAILIAYGADVTIAQDDGETPLHSAASGGYYDLVQLMIDKGANVNAAQQSSNFTVLHAAAYFGHTEIMKLLIAHGADQKARNWNNKTADDLLQEYKKNHQRD